MTRHRHRPALPPPLAHPAPATGFPCWSSYDQARSWPAAFAHAVPPPTNAPSPHSLQVCSDVASSLSTPIFQTGKPRPACFIPMPRASPAFVLLGGCPLSDPGTRSAVLSRPLSLLCLPPPRHKPAGAHVHLPWAPEVARSRCSINAASLWGSGCPGHISHQPLHIPKGVRLHLEQTLCLAPCQAREEEQEPAPPPWTFPRTQGRARGTGCRQLPGLPSRHLTPPGWPICLTALLSWAALSQWLLLSEPGSGLCKGGWGVTAGSAL